ncbi:MAG TPA: putative dsRNA-binding protein, partial [Gammaproteobacteria bacterium]|nr:putative dsRNA-binding protein [Gammaproteobacteria bacterium]
AVIGAVYLDSGIDTARELVRRLFGARLASALGERELKDAKTRLQEYQQARGLELPVYEVVSVSGEAHDQTFVVACRIDDIGLVTEGRNSSRRKAEQAAAAEALSRIEND